jgi:ubiquinone/menaquinone biosynthesis C-methylase UbiE
MTEKGKAFRRLKERSLSPYDPEPPRSSFWVNVVYRMCQLRRKPKYYSPHLFHGDNHSKVEWEYHQGPEFFERLSPYFCIDALHGKDVLDVGCGWGGKAIYYAEHSGCTTIRGFDLPGVYQPEASQDFAREKGVNNCFFKTGYAEEMPYENEQFDVILMDDVLEHVKDPEKVMRECSRVLKREGLLVAKFPSFKMAYAHHLDRAIVFPGLHYFVSMKTWAAGFNDILLQPKNQLTFEPFDQVVSTKYHRCITKNLNGLDFAYFQEIVHRSPFEPLVLKLIPLGSGGERRKVLKKIYDTVFEIKYLQEYLAHFVLFIGRKGSGSSSKQWPNTKHAD